jgi:hypothetical protein
VIKISKSTYYADIEGEPETLAPEERIIVAAKCNICGNTKNSTTFYKHLQQRICWKCGIKITSDSRKGIEYYMINNNQGFDPATIDQLMKDFELAQENGQPQILPTRASMKRKFLDLNPENFLEMQAAMENLDDHFGVTNTTIRHLSQDEIDSMVEELVTVRKCGDILSSREEALKVFAKNIISLDQIDPNTTAGELVSSKHKLKISKEIRGGKLSVDVNLLKNRLTPLQFMSVTNEIETTVVKTFPNGKTETETTTSYEVNEKALETEMVNGNILSEDVFLSSVESKRTMAIYIRELES